MQKKLFIDTVGGNMHILNTEAGRLINSYTYKHPINIAVSISNETVFLTEGNALHALIDID